MEDVPQARGRAGELSTDPTNLLAEQQLPRPPAGLTHLPSQLEKGPEEQSQVLPAFGKKRWVLRGR